MYYTTFALQVIFYVSMVTYGFWIEESSFLGINLIMEKESSESRSRFIKYVEYFEHWPNPPSAFLDRDFMMCICVFYRYVSDVHKHTNSTGWIHGTVIQNRHSGVVEGLTPYSNYRFRVRAFVKQGGTEKQSTPSEELHLATREAREFSLTFKNVSIWTSFTIKENVCFT